jgi:hypothetical protein
MKYFYNILSQFTGQQRLLVLIMLLVFTSGTYLTSTLLKQDDCKMLIDENLELQNDLVTISRMVRELRKSELNINNYVVRDTVFIVESFEPVVGTYEIIEEPNTSEHIPNLEEFDKTTKEILDIIDGEGFQK